MSILQSWLRDMRDGMLQQVPPIVCNSGLQMSVQASRHHYCTPRNDVGPWTHVEIGFPNKDLPEIAEYSDGEDSSVYGWVPIGLVEKIVEDNGGIGDPS